MSRYLMFLTGIVLFAACERRDNPAQSRARAAEALRGVLAYPQSSLISASAGSEAAELLLSSTASVDEIAGWYRQALPLNKWEIKTDSKNRTGTVTIYAEQEKRPLWITLDPSSGGTGTTYRLIGVFRIDSTKADSTRR
jgi:hypothetical protein